MLSPLLFSIYVNEITTMFQNTDSDPFKLPNRTKLNCLMYADDLIIVPKTKLGLQNWCNKLLMKINLKKAEVIIFQKGNPRSMKPVFTLQNSVINVTKEYCYLGVKINQNGTFKLALKQLAEKAQHALFSIRRQLNLY